MQASCDHTGFHVGCRDEVAKDVRITWLYESISNTSLTQHFTPTSCARFHFTSIRSWVQSIALLQNARLIRREAPICHRKAFEAAGGTSVHTVDPGGCHVEIKDGDRRVCQARKTMLSFDRKVCRWLQSCKPPNFKPEELWYHLQLCR